VSVVSVTARNDPNLLTKLGKTLKCATYQNNSEKGILDPKSKEAKIDLQLIDPLVQITGSKIHGSPAGRKMAIRTLMSRVQFYGCPSIFFTFAPDIHSVLTFRMSCPTENGNEKFPAVDDCFEQIIRQRNNNDTNNNLLHDEINIEEVICTS
jgi:hypothetical protein